MKNFRVSALAAAMLGTSFLVAQAQPAPQATPPAAAQDSGPLIQALKQQLMAGIQAELEVRTQLATLQGEVGNLQATIQKLQQDALEKATKK